MNIEITIPEGWEDIKLGEYMEYMRAVKAYEGTEVAEVVQYEKAMNHFCNITTETIHQLPMENYNGILAEMMKLFQQGDTMPLTKHFVLGSTKFGFIPSLDNMSYGEYLDLSTYSKDLWTNAPTVMSILYRPVTKELDGKYEIQAYQGTNEDMETLFKHALTMDIVWGAIGFFTLLSKDLLKGMMGFSMKTLEEMKSNTLVQETLTANGVDISVLQSSQEMISQGLMKLQD
jgi:hypothetical protein